MKQKWAFVKRCSVCGKVFPKDCPRVCPKCKTTLIIDEDQEGVKYYGPEVQFLVAHRTWYGRYKLEDWIFDEGKK